MAMIVEDGSGMAGGNSYISLAYILDYLTVRGRQSENNWSTLTTAKQQAACIAGTDYLENRFRLRFKGKKQFTSLTHAKAVLTLTGNPTNGQTVTINGRVYTFNTVLGGADSVLIEANAHESMNNLIDALNADPDGLGVDYGSGTTLNAEVAATAFELDTLIVEAKTSGTPGNLLTVSTDVAGAFWSSATLIGGTDTGRAQPLSFPREWLYDAENLVVAGVPDRVKQATCEYAVRAAGSPLLPDPDISSGQRIIEREELLGPLKERTKWMEGGTVHTFMHYPAADRLLAEYLQPSGMVLRA